MKNQTEECIAYAKNGIILLWNGKIKKGDNVLAIPTNKQINEFLLVNALLMAATLFIGYANVYWQNMYFMATVYRVVSHD